MTDLIQHLRSAANRATRVNADVALLCEHALRSADYMEQLERELALAKVGEFAGQAGQGHLSALVDVNQEDAGRYRKLRDLPDDQLGVAGVPCIAIPDGATSGNYANGEDADAAIDAMPPKKPTTDASGEVK